MTLFLDLLVIALLITAIGVAVVLNKRLAAFRAAKGEFEQIIERFNTAAARAETGLNAMRMSGAESGQALQQNIVTARALRDELTFLVERAEPIVDRLGAVARAAVPRTPETRAATPKPEPAKAAPAPAAPTPQPTQAAGKPADTDLLKYLSSLR